MTSYTPCNDREGAPFFGGRLVVYSFLVHCEREAVHVGKADDLVFHPLLERNEFLRTSWKDRQNLP